MDRMGLYEGMVEVTESTQTIQDDSGKFFQAETEAEALEMWETEARGDLAACGAEEIGPHTYKLEREPETVNRLYVRAAEYTFEFSKWTDGSGYDYTETIANGPTWKQGDAAALGDEYCTNPGDRVEILTPAGEVVEKYIKK